MPSLATKTAAKRTLRIVSKCSTRAEFVAVFRRLCDGASIFIATTAPKAEGMKVRFNITLVDGKSMLSGDGTVEASHRDSDNPWGRAGMRIAFDALDPTSLETLDLLTSTPPPPPGPAKNGNGQVQSSESGTPPPARGSAPAPLPKNPIVIPTHIPPVKPIDSGWDAEDDEDEKNDTQVSPDPIAPAEKAPDAGDAKQEQEAAEKKTEGAEPKTGETESEAAPSPPLEERAKGSDYILPANPFGELAPEMLEAFIECTLYEETGSIDLPEAPGSPADDSGTPHWWPGTGKTPPPDLTPETAPPDDEPDTDLRAMVDGAMGIGAPIAAGPMAGAPTPPPASAMQQPPAPGAASPPSGPWAQAAQTPLPQAAQTPLPQAQDVQPPPGPWAQAAQQSPTVPRAPTIPRPATPPPVPGMAAESHPGFARPATPIPVGHPGAMAATPFAPPQRAPTPTDLVVIQQHSWKKMAIIIGGAMVATLLLGYLIWGGGGDTNAAATGDESEEQNAKNGVDDKGAEPNDVDNGAKAAAAGEDKVAQPPGDPTEDKDPADEAQELAEPADGEKVADKAVDPIEEVAKPSGDAAEDATKPAADAEKAAATATTAAVGEGECLVELDSRPQGAIAYLGTKRLAVTPATVSLPCSTKSILLKRSRYKPTRLALKLAADETSKAKARLERPIFVLRVASRPKATLYVGGRRVGPTPRSAKVPGYERTTVKLVRKGYKTWSKKIYVKKKSRALRVRLQRKR